MPLVGHYIDPYKYSKFEDGREEAEMVVFSAIDELFSKTSVAPEAIDILVTNCSEFNPTPRSCQWVLHRILLWNRETKDGKLQCFLHLKN